MISDINAACRTEPADELSYPKSFEEEMEEIDRWLEGEEYEHTFVITVACNQKIFLHLNSCQMRSLKW